MLSLVSNILLLLGSFLIAASRGNLSHDQSQPTTSDETVVAGSKVTLRCYVEDYDNSSLQWSNPAQQTLYFGEKRALRDNRIQLVNSTPNELTISIDDVVLADEGEYTCSIFTMPVRTAKASVTVLGIPQEPRITGYIRPLQDGQSVKLTCVSSGSKPAAKLHWLKGEKMFEGNSSKESPDSNGKTYTVTSIFEFTVNKDDDGAEVTCQVKHPSLQNVEKSTSQKLEVYYIPIVSIEPHPTHPREGEQLKLNCIGKGNPVPREFSWQKDGSTTDANGNILNFSNLNKSDGGTYFCFASNLIGQGKGQYKLTVHDASPMSHNSMYHAVIGGVVAIIVFFVLILLIVLGHYLIRHKGTYLTHEAKGSDDAPDADTAIINAEGGQTGGDDKKEYFI